MGIDIIDILFIIMAAFGFYFGFNFGLMKVVLMVASLVFAILTAMAFTPRTTSLIIDTFDVDSVFLPFIAFVVTLLVVLMLSRILTKLIEETVDNKRFDIISQVIGGLVMGLVFTLLYSVLVIFFGKAGVIQMIFNDGMMVVRSESSIQLEIPGKVMGDPDTMYMTMNNRPDSYRFVGLKEKDSVNVKVDKVVGPKGAASLSLGFKSLPGNQYLGYIAGKSNDWKIKPRDTVQVKTKGVIYLKIAAKKVCFCDSTFLVRSSNDTLYFDCTDDFLAAKSTTSILYKYIDVIPKRMHQLMVGLSPLMSTFIEYMSIALERLNEGKHPNSGLIDAMSEEENKSPAQPTDEETSEESPPEEKKKVEATTDSVNYSADTSNTPTTKPKIDTIPKTEDPKQKEVVDNEK